MLHCSKKEPLSPAPLRDVSLELFCIQQPRASRWQWSDLDGTWDVETQRCRVSPAGWWGTVPRTRVCAPESLLQDPPTGSLVSSLISLSLKSILIKIKWEVLACQKVVIPVFSQPGSGSASGPLEAWPGGSSLSLSPFHCVPGLLLSAPEATSPSWPAAFPCLPFLGGANSLSGQEPWTLAPGWGRVHLRGCRWSTGTEWAVPGGQVAQYSPAGPLPWGRDWRPGFEFILHQGTGKGNSDLQPATQHLRTTVS